MSATGVVGLLVAAAVGILYAIGRLTKVKADETIGGLEKDRKATQDAAAAGDDATVLDEFRKQVDQGGKTFGHK